jgi:hypothetical protein
VNSYDRNFLGGWTEGARGLNALLKNNSEAVVHTVISRSRHDYVDYRNDPDSQGHLNGYGAAYLAAWGE